LRCAGADNDPRLSAQDQARRNDLQATLSELTAPVSDIGESLLVSAVYDGDRRVAVLKFYDQKAERVRLWQDNTGHRPYCFTKLPRAELDEIASRKDVIEIAEEEREDLLNDARVKVRKIVTTDPLAIGGGNDSIRDRIRAWEADIKYYENYAYDRGLRMGTYYKVERGKVVAVKHPVPERVARSLEEVTRRNPNEFAPYLSEWAELLGEPLADFRRVALDIEVANEAGRLPDAEDPKRPVIAVSFFNEAEKTVYVLRSGKDAGGLEGKPFACRVFDDEGELLRAVMAKIMQYPFLVTFNGDDFDLRYLQHRAEKLGIREEEDPIQLERVAAALKHGVHIDLYQFFRNRSIQVYAFGNRYTEHTLGGICESLLNKSKIEFEGEVGDLPLGELAAYCLNDSQLTYELTSMGGDLVMKLLLVISRIGKMPMNDAARLGVSNWIRSMLFYEHRRLGALIPRQDELAEKGEASSKAIIKGKKYKGGFVIEPKPGVYFDVSVLDFASLVYDETIFVRKRQTGQVYKVKIGEFVEDRLPEGTGFSAKEIGPTWDVLSFDYGRKQAAWKTVTAVIRHPNHEEVLEVETESGRRVRITKGHSLITLDLEGEKKTIRGCDLKVGDYLIALSSFVAEQGQSSLDLLPYFRQLPDYKITRGGRGAGTNVVLKSNHSHRKFVLNRYLPISPDLMWGFGYWAAEGWLGGDEYGKSLQIEASSPDIHLAQSKFGSAGFKTWSAASKTSGCSTLGIRSRYDSGVNVLPERILAELVKSWFGGRAREKKIADWIFQVPLNMRLAFFDGYYTGDGYNANKYGQFVTNGKFKTGSYSARLIDNLMSLGLMSGLQCFSKNIRPRESYLTWSDGPSAYHATKRPPPQLLARAEHVQSFAQTPYYASHPWQPGRYERVNRTSVSEYSEPLKRFYQGNCHFEKVKKIRVVKNELPVYDISVRGSESFFNCDGILVSNSLYPSLIKVHNLSYETVNCPHPECRDNKVPDTSSWVCRRNRGLTSLVIGSLRDLRVSHYKQLAKDPTLSKEERELYNVVSQGLKVYLNAAYGSFGFESFAFYCLPVAEATAALGRDAITRTMDKCRELGVEVLYGDTDSTFLRSPSKEQVATVMKWVNAELGVELDLDKVYRYVAFSSRKKNYFGVLPDGTVDIRGLTGKKSMTPEYLKETFYSALEILSQVQTPEDFEKARARIRELLGGMISSLKGRKVPVEKLAFTVMMGKPTAKYNGTTPQHVRAAMQLEERGREIKAGEMIAYVKTKSPPYVKAVDIAKVEDVDPDKYIEYAHSMFDQMLDALDFSFDEIMGATTLDLFWSS
jgi:DNA polymerase elongation subunit (family B)